MDKLWIAGFISLLIGNSAGAALGEREASVEKDRQSISGIDRELKTQGPYSVREIENGQLKIREYIANGVVFGVAWNGTHHADLGALLGSYFSDFQEAAKKPAKRRGHPFHRKISGNKVVVEKAGHMRWAQGKAYVPELIPAGVSTDEIR